MIKWSKTCLKVTVIDPTYSLGLNLSAAKRFSHWAVVVAQLVERSLPIPEVHGSNPAIGKIY